MQRGRFIGLLFAGSLAASCGRRGSAANVSPAEKADPRAQLEAIRTRLEVPGLAALALRGDRVLGQFEVGVRKIGSRAAITPADLFHLGSETKAMTATLLALLVAEGKVQWSTTLGEIFGGAVPAMHEGWKRVPLQLVLGHRAGFPANVDPAKRRRNFPDAPVTALRRSFVADALAAPPETPPGSKFEYSNTGYIVIGAAIEQLTGASWDELMQERLFAPLGITSGGFGAPGKSGELDQPRGHRESGTAVDPGDPGADNPKIYGPAGTVHMTIGDWAKFIALHLRGDPANPHGEARLLSREAFGHLHAPVDGAAQGYACGWGVLTRDWARGAAAGATGRVLSHAGSNTMWHAVAWLAPEIDFALLACCNRGGARAAQACDEAVSLLLRKFKDAR